MRINKIENRLIYSPNREFGQSEFKGTPRPSSEVIEQIGEEGLEYIKNKLNSLIDSRKEMFGIGHIDQYGMDAVQHFFDLKHRTIIRVSEIIHEEHHIHPKELLFENRPSADYHLSIHPATRRLLAKGSNNEAYRSVLRLGAKAIIQ